MCTWHPCSYRAAIEIPDPAECFDELDGLEIVVEDEFTAGDATIDVVRSSRDEQAGMSRHRIPPMRGRDNTILSTQPHNSTNVSQVGPGGCPPRPPTDPDVRDYRIRLLGMGFRYVRQTE